MKTFVLSDRADRSFEQILEWTFEQFGQRQVECYHDTWMDRCSAIANGTVPHQSCRTMFAEDLREDLRFARAGQHFGVFVETETTVVIVDFLHQSADIAGRLG